jgi:hypothetical protein
MTVSNPLMAIKVRVRVTPQTVTNRAMVTVLMGLTVTIRTVKTQPMATRLTVKTVTPLRVTVRTVTHPMSQAMSHPVRATASQNHLREGVR